MSLPHHCTALQVVRLRVDIGDLSLSGVEPHLTRGGERVVGVSKHLCGAATDLSLRYHSIEY